IHEGTHASCGHDGIQNQKSKFGLNAETQNQNGKNAMRRPAARPAGRASANLALRRLSPPE
ncbi:hypothetical protein, partial [uncultured Aquitalea sp.]|uniref:hypothetical protein n=1 Tax=uncultured Aquitalea sp. TaxID=540272 RepID=UPI0025E0F1DA